MITLIISILSVLLASAICSSAEAALFSVSIIKAKQLAKSGSVSGKSLLKIQENMNRPIAAIVVLNNIANIVGSIAIGSIASDVLGSNLIGYFSGALTFLVIMFAEIIPKTLGERHADKISVWVSRPILLLSKVMSPVLWLIEKVAYPFIGNAPVKYTTNESEIKLLARIGDQEGVIEKRESEIIQKAFELNNTTAKMIMTPRVSLTMLGATKTLDEVRDFIIESQHSRIVVCGETVDHVLGIVMKDDLLIELVNGNGHKKVEEFYSEGQYVQEDRTAESLLKQFQESNKHLSIVVDEFGGVSGVVTLEDVLEVLTGEIVDETDSVVDMQEFSRQNNQIDV